VAVVSSSTSKCFSYSPECTFGFEEFYEGGPRVSRPPIKWPEIDGSLRNTDIVYVLEGGTIFAVPPQNKQKHIPHAHFFNKFGKP
jgi:hypothetical protein